ncbi:PTS glucose transporter subunit IIA [Lactobacillus delbrueckii subsp. bulgaricus]
MFRIFDLLKSRTRLSKVLAPVQGRLFPLEDVNDEIFASEGLGEGFAVQPSSDLIYAPLNGTVTSLFPTNHEIGIRTKEGLDLLIHLGLNTVELGGGGCDILVEAGQEVKKGSYWRR